MAKLCQDDFAVVRPHEYFPETFNDGTCDACGAVTFVARVTKAEVELAKQPTETPLERMQREERSGLAGYHTAHTKEQS